MGKNDNIFSTLGPSDILIPHNLPLTLSSLTLQKEVRQWVGVLGIFFVLLPLCHPETGGLITFSRRRPIENSCTVVLWTLAISLVG